MRASLAAGVACLLVAAAPASAATRACQSPVDKGVLPSWARGGFSDPRPRLPHVLGRSGEIAALLFGYPLSTPERKDRGNKILWVSRRAVKPPSELRIHAQRMRGRERVGRPVVRIVRGGPGPSGVNLPVPGCWRLTLQWSGRTDHLDLEYVSSR
jgi:hypothetical protein